MIINASGGNADAVMTVAQTLSDTQKTQARTNIGALSDTDGSVSTVYTAKLLLKNSGGTDCWIAQTGGGYAQSVVIPGILETDNRVLIDINSENKSGTDMLSYDEAWSFVYGKTQNGSVNIIFREKPTVEIPIRLTVWRK